MDSPHKGTPHNSFTEMISFIYLLDGPYFIEVPQFLLLIKAPLKVHVINRQIK